MRAFNPWPGAYAFWRKGSRQLKIDVLKADIISCTDSVATGTVFSKNDGITIRTSDGCLEISELRLEGKKSMDAKSFLNGHKDVVGSALT